MRPLEVWHLCLSQIGFQNCDDYPNSPNSLSLQNLAGNLVGTSFFATATVSASSPGSKSDYKGRRKREGNFYLNISKHKMGEGSREGKVYLL